MVWIHDKTPSNFLPIQLFIFLKVYLAILSYNPIQKTNKKMIQGSKMRGDQGLKKGNIHWEKNRKYSIFSLRKYSYLSHLCQLNQYFLLFSPFFVISRHFLNIFQTFSQYFLRNSEIIFSHSLGFLIFSRKFKTLGRCSGPLRAKPKRMIIHQLIGHWPIIDKTNSCKQTRQTFLTPPSG